MVEPFIIGKLPNAMRSEKWPFWMHIHILLPLGYHQACFATLPLNGGSNNGSTDGGRLNGEGLTEALSLLAFIS
jgi:hypothetical protein